MSGKEEAKYQWVVFLQPMRKWNLHNEFKNGVNTGGNIQYVMAIWRHWHFCVIARLHQFYESCHCEK